MEAKDIQLYKEWQASPLKFIKDMWGLVPQKKEEDFVKGKHITWQQADILFALEKAIANEAPRRIAIKSGHGIGKSATLAMLLIWFLFCHKNAQIPCTAPTSDQLNDVLWKEIQLWLTRMPKEIEELFDWGMQYIRIKESPNTWFARARTASKDRPEALAGIHADHVMMLVDEASGVHEAIYNVAEGALTSNNIFVILISNPTRLEGYFYDCFHSDQDNWQNLSFSSIESPIVDWQYVERIKEKNTENSDEYRIRVLGEFPAEDAIDDKGYVALLNKSDLRYCEDEGFIGDLMMGVDPSGEGQDETVWVVRDNFRAKIVGREKISNSRSIAEKTVTLMDKYGVQPHNVMVDNFGIGADVAVEIGLTDQRYRVGTINVGEKTGDKDYINMRAKAFYEMRRWLQSGGELIDDERWKELLHMKYKRTLKGSIQIKPKQEMRKDGYESPNYADALMLTFVRKKKSDGSKQYYPHLKEKGVKRGAKQYYPHLQGY